MRLKRFRTILASFIILFGVISAVYAVTTSISESWYLSKDCRYVITEKVTLGIAGRSPASKYIFKINNAPYQGFTALPLKLDGTRYFIKFYPKNPDYNAATPVVADSTDIKNMPTEGYDSLPHNNVHR